MAGEALDFAVVDDDGVFLGAEFLAVVEEDAVDGLAGLLGEVSAELESTDADAEGAGDVEEAVAVGVVEDE